LIDHFESIMLFFNVSLKPYALQRCSGYKLAVQLSFVEVFLGFISTE